MNRLRLTARKVRLRDEDGVIAIQSLIIMVMLALVALVILNAAKTATARSEDSREFIQSRHNLETAFASAIDSLNADLPRPTAATPQPGISAGIDSHWSWYYENGDVVATGTARGTTLTVRRPVRSQLVNSWQRVDGAPQYALAPAGAWLTALASADDSKVAGTVTGGHALLGPGALDARTATHDRVISYNDKAAYDGDTRADRSVLTATMGTDALREAGDYCATRSVGDWRASEHAYRVVATSGVLCVDDFTIDGPVRVQGTVPAVVHAAGEVTIDAGVDHDTTTQLQVIAATTRSVWITTDEALNVHVYAPRALCHTAPSVHAHVTGSLACRELRVNGTFTHSPARPRTYPAAALDTLALPHALYFYDPTLPDGSTEEATP